MAATLSLPRWKKPRQQPQPTTTMKNPQHHPLKPDDSLRLIDEVLKKAFASTETWRDESLGTDLAYLCHAIADRRRGHFVDWSDELRGMAGVEGETLKGFREWFPRRHVVWRFIRT
jgi:hypothetical protein